MIEHQGVFLPEGETHLTKWMTDNGEIVDGRGSYQIKKLRAALKHCRQFRTAVDVGGHCGLWSMQLVKQFALVHAFEPVAAHRDCFARNLDAVIADGAKGRHMLHACALGDHEGHVVIDSAPSSSGDSRVGGEVAEGIPLCRLDTFGLHDVDFIKLDCEGYELFALKGGEATIARDLPTIIVEQKPGRAQRFGLPELGAVEWLQSLGYKCVEKLSGDFVMVPG